MCFCTLHQQDEVFSRPQACHQGRPGLPAIVYPRHPGQSAGGTCSECSVFSYHHLPSHFLPIVSHVVFTSLLSQFKYISSCRRSASPRTSKRNRWRKTGGPFDKMKSMSVLTKIDLFLLPLLLLAAFLSALDKVCIAVFHSPLPYRDNLPRANTDQAVLIETECIGIRGRSGYER